MKRSKRSHIIAKLPPLAKVVLTGVVCPDLDPALEHAAEGFVADLVRLVQRLGGICIDSAVFRSTLDGEDDGEPAVAAEPPDPDSFDALLDEYDFDHVAVPNLSWDPEDRWAQVGLALHSRGGEETWSQSMPLSDGTVWQGRLSLASELVAAATQSPIDVRPLLGEGPSGLAAYRLGCEARCDRLPLTDRVIKARAAVDAEPGYDEAWLLLQDLLFAAGHAADAERMIEDLPDRFPRSARAFLKRSQLRQKRGRAPEARKDAYQVASLDADGLTLYEAGVFMRTIGDEEGGGETMQRAVGRRCCDPFLYEQLGVFRANQGEEVAAVLLWERALAIDPSLYGILANLALGHHRLGNDDRADELFAEAGARAPEHFATHYNLGLYYQDLQSWDMALTHLDKGIEMRPQLALLHLGRGNCLYKLGRVDEATRAFEQALELDRGGAMGRQAEQELARIRNPEDPDSTSREFFHRGADRARSNRPQQAVPFLREAVKLQPGYWQAWFYLGTCYRMLERWEAAVEAFRRVISLRGEQADAFNELAIALGQLGRRDEAMEHARRAHDLRPGDAGIISNLGLALMELGRFDEARHQFKRARKLDPADPIIKRYLKEQESRIS